MKPGKLYIKIFLSFVLVLIVTEIMIFGLFVIFAGRSFHARMERYVNAQSSIIKEYIEDKIRSEPELGPAHNRALRKLIFNLGENYRARIWLTDPNGKILIKSFDGDIPVDTTRFRERHAEDSSPIRPYHHIKKGMVYYVYVPVTFRKGELGGIHMVSEKPESARPEWVFALGLAVIGLVIALLIIPVSRRITGPLKRLSRSALQIAEGDLSHRATVKSKDEIGELGRSFNHMADRLERMIKGGRELTANISHELRTPLARIGIASELIRESGKRGDYTGVAGHLDDIREDIEELDRLIERILLLSKIDIHETALKFESFDPMEQMNEIIERLRPAIRRKDLQVMTDLAYDPPFFGDRDSLRTAFSNILDNAVKFTPEGGRVTAKMVQESGWLKIKVANSFWALSKEDLDGIFDPFFRGKQSPEAGSGLGLAIAKKIIERHGGSIKAMSSSKEFVIHIGIPVRQSDHGS